MALRGNLPFIPDRKRDHPLLICYLEQLCAEGRSWMAARTAGHSFTQWLASGPFAGQKATPVTVDLSQVTSEDLIQYKTHAVRQPRSGHVKQLTLDDLEGKHPRSPKKLDYVSIRGYCIRIWQWLQFLSLRDHIPHDPTLTVSGLPKGKHQAVGRIFTTEEVDRFLHAIVKYSDQKLRDLAAFGCLSGLGLRASELIRMTVDDVDTRRHRELRVLGKGDHERLIPLEGSVLEALDRYLETRQESDPTGPLWQLPGQRRLKYPELLARHHRFRHQAGILDSGKTPHAFRHFFVTQQLLKGHNPELVSMFVGHNSPRELEPYFHMSDLLLRNRIFEAYGFDVDKPFGGIKSVVGEHHEPAGHDPVDPGLGWD